MYYQHEPACDRICDDIAQVLMELRPPTSGAAYSAAIATKTIAAAMHRAAGRPQDALWGTAVACLDRFVASYAPRLRNDRLPALLELRAFLDENADLLEFAKAS